MRSAAALRQEPTFTETARRAQIVAAAIDTIAEVGYARASLARIGARIGTSKGLIGYHFAGKDDLQGAANATGMSPLYYLRSVGELRTPIATPVPTRSSPTATPTTAPMPTGFLDGSIDRAVYVVGSRPPVVFRLEVTNDGDVPIDGVEVSVDGPMDKFTITGVTPGGSYLGRAFDWPLTIPPHDKRSLQITTFANEPGTYAFRLDCETLPAMS